MHLKESDVFRLAEQNEEYKQQGQDLLGALAADITRQINEVQARITSWRSDGHKKGEGMVSESA